MPIKVTCGNCGGVLHAPDDSAGKRGRCPTCGSILPIPADAPRVAAVDPIPAPAPQPNVPAESRPPALGSDLQRAPVPVAAPPRQPGDPFARTAAAPVAVPEGSAKRWARVASGLGFVRLGVLCMFIGVLAPSAIAILEQNNIKLPDKDPGMLGVPGVALSGEIKVAASLTFLLFGGLFLVLGRLRVASVPRDAGARGMATAAAYATLVAFICFAAIIVFGVSATLEQAPPQIIPLTDVTAPNVMFQTRVERYVQHLFLDPDNMPGQVQRIGAVLLLVCGIVGELWFLGALARIAVHLRNAKAIGRLNRHSILAGLLLILLAGGVAVFSFFGDALMRDTINPQWNKLDDGAKVAVRAGSAALIVFIAAFLYLRSLSGVRRAIREQHTA